MKLTIIPVIMTLFAVFTGCGNEGRIDNMPWEQIKAATILEYNSAEYNRPYQQPLSTMGWEDGIYISRDGNYLYCTYAPGDRSVSLCHKFK